ncbi:MAG: alpha/beta hydrolase [Hyphomicrobiaceae bacterium]|nr:alpha/beta hydrolase [Hyphomicrobiaceae bacterium]
MQLSAVKDPVLLRLSDELCLRYEISGSGPPLLLLHTIRTQLEYFRALAPLLAREFTVYAMDLPGHGYSPIDASAPFDEPYMRKAVVGVIEALDLRDVTIAGESIGAVLALTAAAELPDRVRAVYALNPYDYEMRYGDGIRRGGWFSNLIIGSLQVPIFGAIGASIENRKILGQIMGGGYSDPSKLPDDLLIDFDKAARGPGYRSASRKVLAGWRSWAEARKHYATVRAPVTLVYGDKDWSHVGERERTKATLPNVRMFTLTNTGHFSSVENPNGVARIILSR